MNKQERNAIAKCKAKNRIKNMLGSCPTMNSHEPQPTWDAVYNNGGYLLKDTACPKSDKITAAEHKSAIKRDRKYDVSEDINEYYCRYDEIDEENEIISL